MEVRGYILVNETVRRNSFFLFTVCFTDAAKLAKSSFLQFQYKNYFIVITTYSQLFWLLHITRRYLVTNLNNESSLVSAFTE
jgi:hypothetical protein